MAAGVTAKAAPSPTRNASISRVSSGNAQSPAGARGAALVGDHVVDRLVDVPGGLPARELLQRGGVGLATAELLEPRLVRLLVRHQLDRGVGRASLDHTTRQLDDRELHGGAHVVN